MYARTDGIATSVASAALTRTTRAPERSASTTAAGGPLGLGGAGWCSPRRRTRRSRRATSGAGSMCSAPSRSMLATAAESASRHSKTTSTASGLSPPLRWRSSSKTSSMVWVSAAMPAKPIVALIPFRECAMRKISLTVSASVGSASIRTTARLSS